MLAEWDVGFELRVDGVGSLQLNYTDPNTAQRWQLVPAKCNVSLPVRSTEDDVPQFDGKIPHRRWRSGYGVHLTLEPYQEFDDTSKEGVPACGATLVEMIDTLGLYTNAMIRTGLLSGLPDARLIWTPTGKSATRMFDRLQLQSDPVLTVLDGELGGAQIEFDLDSPYPYYVSGQDEHVFLSQTGPVTVTNDGNADYYPVVQINGDTDYVTITNHSVSDTDGNDLLLRYDASLPPGVGLNILAPHYVEIVFFNGTAYLDGNLARRLGAIDFRYTDFFPLIPGDNVIEIDGGSAIMIAASAWA